ncbi:MAG: hypothetical protein A2X56_13500 [Nitrospirae bacterium GWC2_57_13]|nr:MAG: hypothetical protein A2X56_13500 [Nitrospirae bacterium GWC2_57_13]HAS53651.1 hypothetical protein [Nitrospiraceae bacterium]
MKVFLIALFMVTLGLHHAAIADDDCQFDQQDQIEVLRKLQAKYKGSTLAEGERELTINRGNSVIRFQRGGCEHLGITIKYQTTEKKDYRTKDALFSKAGELLEEFGQEFIGIAEFKDLIKQGSFRLLQEKDPVIYSIELKRLSSVEVMYSEEGGTKVIEVGYYL